MLRAFRCFHDKFMADLMQLALVPTLSSAPQASPGVLFWKLPLSLHVEHKVSPIHVFNDKEKSGGKGREELQYILSTKT